MFVREVVFASEEPDEWTPLPGEVIADCAAQHRVARFERIEDASLRHPSGDIEDGFAGDVRQTAQMRRQNDANHGSVCTSTERTAGRSRTIGAQVSPASDDA